MSLCVAHRYSLEEIQQIELACTGGLTVSPTIMDILKYIESQIVIPNEDAAATATGAPDHHRFSDVSRRQSAMAPKRRQHRGGHGGGGHGGGGDPTFQATKRTEVGAFDKQLNDIRAMMNKLSLKNVEVQKPIVVEAMAKFLANLEEEQEDGLQLQTIRKFTDILVSNPFLVKVYVELYAALCMPTFPYHQEFTKVVTETLTTEYMASLRDLQPVVESSEDYDAFCEYNKRNDKRKAWATFFAEASKQCPVTFAPSLLRGMVEELFAVVQQNLVVEHKTHQVDEVTENIAVLLSCGSLELKQDPTVQTSVRELTLKKPKDFPSWSSRALFKYMDLVIH